MADFSAFFAESWHRLKQAELYRPRPNPTFANPRWEASTFRVLALRLSPYRDVDRSTPHLFLAQAVREAVPPAFLDFCFFPAEADRRLLAGSGVPLVTGLESGRSLEDFDLVLVSCAYHLELLNLPFLLLGSGVPPWASARAEAFPPLLLGGSSAMAAQALLQENGDCLADGLFFGEGEGQVPALVRSLFANRGLRKRSRLAAAADAVAGFWPAGDLARPVRQAVCRRPESFGQARPYPLLPGPEAGTARLAVTLGCPFRCSFCFEGYERRPYRRLPADGLLQAARVLKQASGARTVELASFNVNTHPDLPRLLAELNRLFLQVNFMSQRTDILSSTPGLLELELAAGKRGYTLGIEGISDRQRGFLQKHLAEPVIRQLLVRLLAARVREVKLFYVLSGHETGDDFREFRTFLGWLRGERERHGKSPRLIFSFNRLTRMPFTPLAYDRLLLAEEDWEPLLAQARSAVEGTGGEFRLASAWPEYATAQVLALGGTWLAEPLLLLAGRGFCFDRELPPAAWTLLQNWLRERPELLAGLIAEKAGDHRFALGFVKAPVDAVTRYARYQEAAACLDSSPGPRLPPPRLAHLRHTHLQVRPELPAEVEALLRRKARLRPLYTALTVPREAAGASPEWLDAWCLRYLLAAYPELTDNLLDARQCLLGGQGARDRFPPWFGRALFALTAWDPEAVRAALGGAAGDPAAAPIESTAAPAGSAAVSWQRLELTLHLPARFFPRAGDRLLDYLVGEHAPATARREETGLRLEPGARALKKKLLLAGRALTTATGERLELAIGPRFNPRRYLERFPEPGSWRQALVEVHAFTIEAGGDILEPQCRDTPQPGS